MTDFHALARSWPGIIAAASVAGGTLYVLSGGGYIDPALHRSDLLTVNQKIADIDGQLKDNKEEHKQMQTDLRSILVGVGELKGRLPPR
jgi:hypothetical protein